MKKMKIDVKNLPTTIEDVDAWIAVLRVHRAALLGLDAPMVTTPRPAPSPTKPIILVKHSDGYAQEHALNWRIATERASQLRLAGYHVYCVADDRCIIVNVERKRGRLDALDLDVDNGELLPRFPSDYIVKGDPS